MWAPDGINAPASPPKGREKLDEREGGASGN